MATWLRNCFFLVFPNGILLNPRCCTISIHWMSSCFLAQAPIYCLRSSAKDQGITWNVLLVLVHNLVHFLIKRNLREKNYPEPGFKPGTSRSTMWHSTNWAKETMLFKCLKIIYLFQISRRRPWTSIGRHLFSFCTYERSLQPNLTFVKQAKALV